MYQINKTAGPVVLSGDVVGSPWAQADVLTINNYPWYTRGHKQGTAVRLLHDDRNLYVQFLCDDRHIFANRTELNGPVCLDSCVEFFAAIDPAARPDYFNLEINCCGQVHMGFGPGRHGRRLMPPEMAGRMTIVASENGQSRDESPSDYGWWVAAQIPFAVLTEFASPQSASPPVASQPFAAPPRAGTVWKANFYRCGGRTDPQFAAWRNIDWPTPDFHRPEFFGELQFA